MSPASPSFARPLDILPCAFCRGKGTDPFNVMSDKSTCTSCNGTGTRTVPVPWIRCAYCEGTGSYKTYRCPVCEGAGAVGKPDGPTRRCGDCRGHGSDRSSGMVCLACKGVGVVPA